MKEYIFEIISNKKIADKTYEMVLSTPDGAHEVTNPGQFINIKLDGFFSEDRFQYVTGMMKQ